VDLTIRFVEGLGWGRGNIKKWIGSKREIHINRMRYGLLGDRGVAQNVSKFNMHPSTLFATILLIVMDP